MGKKNDSTKAGDGMFDDTDPISLFNHKHWDVCEEVLTSMGWQKVKSENGVDYWLEPECKEYSATWGEAGFNVVTTAGKILKCGCTYTPFQVLVLMKFKRSFTGAYHWVVSRYIKGEQVPYIRVCTDYYKKITKVDRFGIDRTEIKVWKKEEIKQDEGKGVFDRIPKFDDFALVPDNFNYQPVINNCYNLYKAFLHEPVEGSYYWTEILLRHIFGEQYDLGLRYLQILYLHPTHMMPILVLTSKIRQTGKSTFVNWLNMVFGDNMANISPNDLTNDFNSTYSSANIIAVEETLIDKTHTVEKLKSLATGKFITVNPKWVSQYRTPFYGKFILTSNNEDKFARVDQEEIRFFIRKVPVPTIKNHRIEEDMIAEIPAFLHYLTTLPPVDFSKDRSGFTPSELDNDSLKLVKNESLSGLAKELKLLIEDLFLNELCNKNEFKADPPSIKDRFFKQDKDTPRSYIIRTLQNDFNMLPADKPIYFYPFDKDMAKTARPYTFKRADFTDEPVNDLKMSDNNPF